MKILFIFALIYLICDVSAQSWDSKPKKNDDKDERDTYLSFFYLRDIDVYDFTIGFISGIFKRDDSHLWGECFELPPAMVLASLDVYGGFKFEDPAAVFESIADNIEDLGHWGKLAVAIGTKVFKLVSAASGCMTLGNDLYEYGNFLFQNYGLVEFTKNFRKNMADS